VATIVTPGLAAKPCSPHIQRVRTQWPKDRMKILLLTQWFDPEPTFKGLTFARQLQEQGHEVEVLTGFPNYPGGDLYPGYRMRFVQRQIMDGIPVVRVPLYPSHDLHPWRRVANYLSFGLSAMVLGRFVMSPPDVIYAYHPPLTIGAPAILLSSLWRVPFVLDVQDLWPDTLAATGMLPAGRLTAMAGWLCDRVYRRAAAVAVLSPGFRDALIARGVPASKLALIYNWCDEAKLHLETDRELASRLGAGERFNVIFAGTMGRAQGLENVLRAAATLETDCPRVQIILVGGGVENDVLVDRAASMGLGNVIFLPRRPTSEIGPVLAMADVLLIHLADDPLFSITIPSKTQAYMHAGKPILSTVRGDTESLISMAQCGISCEPADPIALARSIQDLAVMSKKDLASMGERGATYYRDHLSLERGASRFAELFERSLAR
jgi:colanic acid biosynthesis glycosyl transferase WcaI